MFYLTLQILTRAGSRIFRRGGGGRGPILGGFWLQHGHFSVKMYVKTKELGPVVGGGGVPAHAPEPMLTVHDFHSVSFSPDETACCCACHVSI